MANSQKRRITAEDLYNFQLIADPQISPDGQHVVFSLKRVDKKTEKKYSNLWVVSVATGELRQFTYGDQTDRQPKWSPDGRTIGFLSNRQDEGQSQFYLLPFHGGEARSLTRLQGKIGRYEWSPDGAKIVCTFQKKEAEAIEREEDEQKKKLGIVSRHITRLAFKEDSVGFVGNEGWHLWLIDTATGEVTQLTDSEVHSEFDPSWSPDGQTIVFRSNRAGDPDLDWDLDDLFVIPANGGEIRQLETPPGLKSDPQFSPDGKWIACYYQGDRRNRWLPKQVCIVPAAASGPVKNLTEAFDFDATHSTLNDLSGSAVVPPTWSTDSQRLYFQVSHHGSTVLKSVSIAGTNLQEVISPGGAVGTYSFDQLQSTLAYFLDTPADPGQVWALDLANGEARQLTDINRDLLAEIELGEIEEVWYQGADNNDLQGWILKPPGFDKTKQYPAILEIHGGPLLQYGRAFMHEFYYLAAHDYVVFFTNPRGGQGYGAAHAKAIYDNWGSADYADLMAWTDLVQQKPYVDANRMGVTGGSYGGYMTNWIISHTDRFKAAVTQRSVSNFISMFGSSDLHHRFQALLGVEQFPWDDLENYWRQSPLKYFANVKTPTLVIHSEQDLRCDIEQGEQVFVALKLLGVETEMVRFPEEPHGLSRMGRTDRRVVRLQHILRWFDRYLK